jgi:hypothetical protein
VTRRSRALAGALAVALALPALALPALVRAQATASTLNSRLDPATRVAVQAIVDSATRARLPTAPLIDKALEGAAKHSDGPNIVSAVRQLSVELGQSKRVLGSAASTAELRAAATAMHAGVSSRDIALLRSAAGPHRRVTLPLAVMTDLIGRDVPVGTASQVVVGLARAGAHDSDLTMFERNVRLDIERGADPSAAAQTRARGVMLHAAPRPGARPAGNQ